MLVLMYAGSIIKERLYHDACLNDPVERHALCMMYTILRPEHDVA